MSLVRLVENSSFFRKKFFSISKLKNEHSQFQKMLFLVFKFLENYSLHISYDLNFLFSREGYLSVNDPESQPDDVLEVCSDDTFHSFATASDTSRDVFFSPMRPSMCPTAVSQLIREESAANTSHVSTKSLILTPTRGQNNQQNLSMSPISTSSGMGNPMLPMGLTFERKIYNEKLIFQKFGILSLKLRREILKIFLKF